MDISLQLNLVEVLKSVRISEMYSSFLNGYISATKLGGGLKIGQNAQLISDYNIVEHG